MRKTLLVILVLLIPQTLLSYDSGMLNLRVPTNLEQGQAEFVVKHRFYGKISDETWDTFFGMDGGANVGISFRYSILEKFEFKISRTRLQKEYTTGLSYAYVISKVLHGQADIQLFSLKPGTQVREKAFFYQLAVQSAPVLKKFTTVVNIGYDAYNEQAGLGLGVDVGILESLSIIGEYFPVLEGDDEVDCFAFGFRIQTYGHRFMFLLGNSRQIGTRRLMLGSDTRDLYFGFNIHRLLLE